ACLAELDALLGLPRASDRFPPDTVGKNTRHRTSGPPPARTPNAEMRRVQEAYEHRPETLRVAVNGFVLGVEPVDAARNALTLTRNISEPIGGVELLSEQDQCLLFLNVVPPPDGAVRQAARVTLSDDRYAELTLTFSSPWPTLHALYVDPLRERAGAAE